MAHTAVLLMAFGGPTCLEAVGPFMCSLMGREPSEELLARVQRRYLTIGGESPLPAIAGSMARALQERLQEAGSDALVGVGMRYSDPLIGDTVRELYHEHGVRRIIAVSLSPFESKVSSGAYREALDEAAADLKDLEIIDAPPLHTIREFTNHYVQSLAGAYQSFGEGAQILTIFSAHSLPVEDLVDDDPYISGLREVSSDIAQRLKMHPGADFVDSAALPGISSFGDLSTPGPWVLAYQSKGNKPGEWLGPDLEDVISAGLAAGFDGVCVCPVGFVTDHMETKYDLDVIAADLVISQDYEWERAEVPNDTPEFMDGMARMVFELMDQQTQLA